MQDTTTDHGERPDPDPDANDPVSDASGVADGGGETDGGDPFDGPEHERHGARAALYSALAGVFRYPDTESFAELTASETLDGVVEAGEKVGLDEEATALREALATADLDTIQAAHTELFGLPSDGGEYPVVPYEANYTVRDDVGQKQRRIATVAGAVEALGLTVADEFDERQDHVALELELLQLLAGWRAVAACTDDADPEAVARIEARILDEHLVDFVPPLANAVRDATDEAVYVAVADLAEALVVDDHRRYAAGSTAGAGDDRTDPERGDP